MTSQELIDSAEKQLIDFLRTRVQPENPLFHISCEEPKYTVPLADGDVHILKPSQK